MGAEVRRLLAALSGSLVLGGVFLGAKVQHVVCGKRNDTDELLRRTFDDFSILPVMFLDRFLELGL